MIIATPPRGYEVALPQDWRWPNFQFEEVWSPPERNGGEGVLGATVELLDKLQALRWACGRGLVVSSCYRTEAHNRAVGGADDSYHKKGLAVDLRMGGNLRYKVLPLAMAFGFNGIGVYPWGLHLDIRISGQTVWAG